MRAWLWLDVDIVDRFFPLFLLFLHAFPIYWWHMYYKSVSRLTWLPHTRIQILLSNRVAIILFIVSVLKHSAILWTKRDTTAPVAGAALILFCLLYISLLLPFFQFLYLTFVLPCGGCTSWYSFQFYTIHNHLFYCAGQKNPQPKMESLHTDYIWHDDFGEKGRDSK